MRFEFIHVEKALYPLTVLCSVLCVSRSGYYAWLQRAPSSRQQQREARVLKVAAVHKKSGERYGSPRVCKQLRRMGEVISFKTVAKLMRDNDLAARQKRRFKVTTDSRDTKRIAPNLLARDFTVEQPNQAWVTDVTAVWTVAGWCYLAAIIDLFSRRVVGWSVSESNDTKLALAALGQAIDARRPPAGLIHHSDRGSPYGSDDYIAALDEHGIIRSMSRKGDCWDNAVAESFFATLEHECRRLRSFRDSADARRGVASYIDGFYNPERLHSTLDYFSPIEFELHSALQLRAA
jgi:putative transposase